MGYQWNDMWTKLQGLDWWHHSSGSSWSIYKIEQYILILVAIHLIIRMTEHNTFFVNLNTINNTMECLALCFLQYFLSKSEYQKHLKYTFSYFCNGRGTRVLCAVIYMNFVDEPPTSRIPLLSSICPKNGNSNMPWTCHQIWKYKSEHGQTTSTMIFQLSFKFHLFKWSFVLPCIKTNCILKSLN